MKNYWLILFIFIPFSDLLLSNWYGKNFASRIFNVPSAICSSSSIACLKRLYITSRIEE